MDMSRVFDEVDRIAMREAVEAIQWVAEEAQFLAENGFYVDNVARRLAAAEMEAEDGERAYLAYAKDLEQDEWNSIWSEWRDNMEAS
jgi:hypothetical protein